MGLDYSVHKILDDKKYNIGDKVYLLTTHEDGLMNRWDKFVGIRDEIVEGSWDILGRGCHHKGFYLFLFLSFLVPYINPAINIHTGVNTNMKTITLTKN